MNKTFIKSVATAVVGLSLAASCSMTKSGENKCSGHNKCSSKADGKNKCSSNGCKSKKKK